MRRIASSDAYRCRLMICHGWTGESFLSGNWIEELLEGLCGGTCKKDTWMSKWKRHPLVRGPYSYSFSTWWPRAIIADNYWRAQRAYPIGRPRFRSYLISG